MNNSRAPSKLHISSLCKETGMVRLNLIPKNNGQEKWDALEWEKPMKGEKDFWNSPTGTR